MERPNYYAVIPADVRYDERLKPSEKILYSEITALINIKGFCYATNLYFSKLYGVHKNSISIWINNLVKYGYLKVKYVLREVEGQKRQERRIYVVKRNEIKKEVEDIKEKVVEEKISVESVKELEEGVSIKRDEVNENVEMGVTKNTGDSQENIMESPNEKVKKINTSRLLQEDYILHTHSQGESEKFPVIREILEKYSEVGLPSFEFPPDNYIVLKAYGELGAKGVFKALEIMGESDFVKNNMSVNTIFKLENLKKALNGSFKNRDRCVEEKKYAERGERIEEGKSEKEKRRNEELEEFLRNNPDVKEEMPELFNVEELFEKR